MNTFESNVPQGLIIGAGATTESTTPARARVAKLAAPARLPYGLSPVDRRTAFCEHACYWIFMLVGAYSLIRSFIL